MLLLGPDEHDSDEDDEEFEEVDVLASKRDKKKGKEVRNSQKSETRKPKNPVFAMHGEEILEDDPTYAGRVVQHRAGRPVRSESGSKEHPSTATDVSTPTEDTEGESRAGENKDVHQAMINSQPTCECH